MGAPGTGGGQGFNTGTAGEGGEAIGEAGRGAMGAQWTGGGQDFNTVQASEETFSKSPSKVRRWPPQSRVVAAIQMSLIGIGVPTRRKLANSRPYCRDTPGATGTGGNKGQVG